MEPQLSNDERLDRGETLTEDFKIPTRTKPYITNYKKEYIKTFTTVAVVLVAVIVAASLLDMKLILLPAAILLGAYLKAKLEDISTVEKVETKMLKDYNFGNLMNITDLKPVASWFTQNGIYSSAYAGLNINTETKESLTREKAHSLFKLLTTYRDLPQPENTIGWAERPYHLTDEGDWVGETDSNIMNSVDFTRTDNETIRVSVKRCPQNPKQ